MLEKWQARKMLTEKSVKNLRTLSGMTQGNFGKYFGIPKSTIQGWEYGQRECNDYILELMYYKMDKEGIIDANVRK